MSTPLVSGCSATLAVAEQTTSCDSGMRATATEGRPASVRWCDVNLLDSTELGSGRTVSRLPTEVV